MTPTHIPLAMRGEGGARWISQAYFAVVMGRPWRNVPPPKKDQWGHLIFEHPDHYTTEITAARDGGRESE